MLKNYLKIALRNLSKYKLHSLINIAGLAIGIAVCMIIYTHVKHELSYDRFHENYDNIQRVVATRNDDGDWIRIRVTPAGLASRLEREFPEIVKTTRVWYFSALLNLDDRSWMADNFGLADSSFFEIFSFRLLAGDSITALKEPNSLVLSETAAKNLFGDENPVGKTIGLYNRMELKITGVMEDFPDNSHIHLNYIMSMSTAPTLYGDESFLDGMSNYSFSTYVLLNPNTDPQSIADKMPEFYRKYVSEESGDRHGFTIQPLSDVHLTPGLLVEDADVVAKKQLYILSFIGLFVLILACINFINLSTARSVQRAREIGLRKVLGADRWQLIRQFLTESIILSLLSIPIAFVLAELFLPVFNSYLGRGSSLMGEGMESLLPFLVLIILFIGIVGGSYPAFYLSRFRPASILRKGVQSSSGKGALRKALIVFQFAISVVMIIGTITVIRQFNFMRTQNPGFDRGMVIFTDMCRGVGEHYDAFRQELLSNPKIENVAAGSHIPGWANMDQSYYTINEGDSIPLQLNTIVIDPDYLETLGITLTMGRNFSRDIAADSTGSYIINQALAAKLGWDDPIGQTLNLGDWRDGKVIGVVKDFNYRSLHQEIQPLVLRLDNDAHWCIIYKIRPGDIEGAIAQLKQTWEKYAVDYPFDYAFLDATQGRLYSNEKRLGQIVSYSAGLAILVACLGLFGLASYTAERRTKEIGIRKVLGAHPADLALMLSTELARWVLVAVIIAWPIAYLLMSRWLEDYAYRVSLGFDIFAFSGILALVVAYITVGLHTVRTALLNPVETLRQE